MLSAVLALIHALSSATSEPLTVDTCLLSESYSFGRARCEIRLHNAGPIPLSVELSAHNVGDSVTPKVLSVPAKGSAEATVEVDIGNAVGRITRGFKAHPSNGHDTYVIVNGFALSALDDVHPSIDFGNLEAVALPVHRTLALSSHDTPDFRIKQVLSSPPGVEVAVEKDGRTLNVSLDREARLGVTEGEIKLAIDTPRQHEAWVHVQASITGEVSAETNPFWFGNIAAGRGRHALIHLNDSAGRDLRISRVDLGMIKGRVDIEPCEQPAAACKALRVTFDDAQPAGVTRAVLDIRLPDLKRHLMLRIWGVLENDATPRDSSVPLPMPPQEDTSTPWTGGIVESIHAPVYAVPIDDPLDPPRGTAPPGEPPQGNGPLLKWTMADEPGAYGYQVFRADAEAGPFVLQNSAVIRIHAKEYAGQPYFWRDNSAKSGSKYWYYVGVVYKDGHKQQLLAPHSIVAK